MSLRSYQVSGFRFSGISAGIKEGKIPDLALIHSEVPATVVGSFTTNRVQAAPVLVSKRHIRSGLCSAVIVNSGNANACTGTQGVKDAKRTVRTTARLLKVPEKKVLVCSTGKIGIPLPIEKFLKRIPEAVRRLSPNNLLKSARAILTTDDSVKVARAEGRIGGVPYRIVGFAKGAGMIAPNMATMLAFLLTDAFVSRRVLEGIFKNCVKETFNRVTVDGDTSTNDTALVLANGLAGNRLFSPKTPDGLRFADSLYSVMDQLARQMVSDGEGATKSVRIEVRSAKNVGDARRIATTVADSLLVKTSFFGEDPNWGRILAAAGRSGATLDPKRVDILYDRVCVARRGISTGPENDRKAKKVMKNKGFTVTIDCHLGAGRYHLSTSDLTLDYVKLNSCYRT